METPTVKKQQQNTFARCFFRCIDEVQKLVIFTIRRGQLWFIRSSEQFTPSEKGV